MSDIRIDMPKDVATIINILEKNGHEAFAVGGCVRDAIMGRTPHDWDITTSAKPFEVKALFKKTIDTGLQHGTVTVMMNHTGYEVTTYRIDGSYSDGRHPEQVTFTDNLVEDLKRRDFTINAMAYNDRAHIVDAFEGTLDLNNKIIRCVGVATERFNEDALRILRAVRFSAQLNFKIEEKTADAVKKLSANLRQISRERIQTELDKLITSNYPDRIKLVCEYGLGEYIFDNAKILNQTQNLNNTQLSLNITEIYENISSVMNSLPADHYLRWAALLIYEDEPNAILKGLKFDNKTIDICHRLNRISKLPIPQSKPEIKRMIVRFGQDIFNNYVFTFLSALNRNGLYNLSTMDEIRNAEVLYNEIITNNDCISMKDMQIKGSDLISLGLTPGKELGEVLNRLFNMVLDEPTLNTYEQLVRLVQQP